MSEALLLCYIGPKQEAQAKWQNTACGMRLKKKVLFGELLFRMTYSLT